METESSLRVGEKSATFQMPFQITNVRDIEVGISTLISLNDNLEFTVNFNRRVGSDIYRFSERYMQALGVDLAKVKNEFKPSMLN